MNHTEDDAVDSYYAMGTSSKGMTVFGFGRSKINKFISEVPRSFSIGIVDSRDQPTVSRVVDLVKRERNKP